MTKNTVEMIVRVPGLFDEDTTFIIKHQGLVAIAHPKSVVITTGDVSEWIGQEDLYIVSNEEGREVDEVIDLSQSGIDHDDDVAQLMQLTCQAILNAGTPGPVCEKWLAKVVTDDVLATRVTRRAAKKAARKAVKAVA